jgi:hypothetical protein
MDLRWTVAEGELIQNGDFEAGTLAGWHQDNGAASTFVINDGSLNPVGPDGPLPPFSGRFSALTDQSIPGRHTICQDITIPPAAVKATLRWWDRIRNHAGAFGPSQQFRVEVRDVHDTVLAIPFFTRPGDPLQSDWMERSFDLTPFRGQTLRVAFVQIDSLGYLNAHLDNVSLVVIPPEATTFSVYMGTSANLGPAQLLGSTTNQFWHVANLQPGTTYFWRIVAVRMGQTAGAIWQFTTAGIDHFEITQPPGSQLAGEPFGVTVWAKNSAGTTVSNFNGLVRLDAMFGPAPIPIFSEDFEVASLEGWTTNFGTFALTDSTASEGNRSLLLSGGNGQPLTGVKRSLPNLKPTRVSFAARAPSSTVAGGAFMIGSGPTAQNAVALFTFSQGGTMGIADSQGGAYLVSYESNRWYHVTLDINWENQTLDFYIDGNLVEQGIPFSGTNVNAVTAIYLYNQSNSTSFWDDIRLEKLSGLEPLSVTPSHITNFVNGKWTGAITVGQPRLRVRLAAHDDSGHHGLGDPFDVVLAGDLSLDVSTSANPMLADDELTYTIRIFNSGPDDVSGVSLRSTWSSPVNVLFAGFGGGGCVVTETNAVCDLPTLPAGATTTVSIVISSGAFGVLTNLCTITPPAPDASAENNSFRTLTEVIPATTVLIDDTSLVEGDVGLAKAVFPLRLSAVARFPVTVYYNTAPGTADSDIDFSSTNGTVVFMPGITNRMIEISIRNDQVRESNETFYVQLIGAQNTFIADSRATGVIVDNDLPVGVAVEDATLIEPSSGTAQMLFRVTLTEPTGVPVQVNFNSSNGGAVAGNDFVVASGTLSIPAGETNGWIAVTINSDGLVETNEPFFLNLSAPVNAVISRSPATGLIIDRDAPPCVFIGDATVVEGDSSSTTALFTIWLSRSNQQPMTVAFRTSNGTAVSGEDYNPVDSFITFPPGVVTQNISIAIVGDFRNEPIEEFLCESRGRYQLLDL